MDASLVAAWLAVQKEFSDIPDIAELTRTCVRLFMAILLGGLIGFEREFS